MDEFEMDSLGENNPKRTSPSIKDFLNKYLSYWIYFVISIVLFIGGAVLYIRKATPKYYAQTLMLVKGERNGLQGDDLITQALTATRSNNMENDLQLMRSIDLMSRIVLENEFNINYYLLGRIKTTDLYLDAPFKLIMQNITDSSAGLTIVIKNLTTNGATIEYGSKPNKISKKLRWNVPFTVSGKQFVLAPRGKDIDGTGSGKYMAIWTPIKQTAGEIGGKLSIDWLDKKTSIIKLGLTIENAQRGKDILNALAVEYDRADLEDKNIASRNTIRFIDDRLEIISRELSGVEGNLENFQGQNQLVNVESQSSEAFGNSNSVSKEILDLNIQKGVVQQIQGYFNSPENSGKLVPSSLGISDPTLGSLISKYNDLAATKEKEKPKLAPNSLILKDLDNQINDVKGSVLENLQNINKNLNLQQNSLEQKNNQYKYFLQSLPSKERKMQEIKRKQSITEGLYLYLLQKREESSISAGAANVSLYRQIDKAVNQGQVEPNGRNIMIMAGLLGLILPFGLIALGDKLNDKITNRSDITNHLNVPVYGEIGHIPKNKSAGILIMKRDVISEQFRLLRTNLSLSGKNNASQVILITSSGVSEGKSLVSINLASVLAIPGKKVALLEFDLRKPGISRNLGLGKEKGLSDFLTGKTIDLSEVYHVAGEIETLHIYPAGELPENPADLILNENVAPLFEVLRRRYDYIIIDTPPVGLVSDAFVLNKYCDLSLFVLRQRYTPKKQIDFIEDIADHERLKKMGIVLNDFKTGGKYGSSYGSPQNYKYGYGEPESKKWYKKILSKSN